MARSFSLTVFALVAMALAAAAAAAQDTAAARAQDAYLAELYSQGVHAYFAGDLEKVHKLLTEAIDQGTHDPRVFYFRGFTYQRLDHPDEATADFRLGAILEVSGESRVSLQAYFTGDFGKAYDLLTDEIAQGNADPRVYYFRGLTHEKLKRPDDALVDFQKASDLGFRGYAPSSYSIGRVFDRIPGSMRFELDEIRRRVRLDAYSSLASRLW